MHNLIKKAVQRGEFMSFWDILCWGIVWILAVIGLSECIMYFYKRLFVSRNDCIESLEVTITINGEDDRLPYLIEYLEEVLDDIPTKSGEVQYYIKSTPEGERLDCELYRLEKEYRNLHIIL